MPDVHSDKANLIADAIAGDADAFGELYQRHLDAIYRYVYLRIGHTLDAQDLTEKVFLKAWEALPNYEQRGNPFTSWLYKIAHNMVIDYHRRTKCIEPMPQKIESKEKSVLDQIIEAEEANLLAKAISQLSTEQQQIILLRFVEGLSHAETSRIVGKSKGACRVIQHRALTALNHLLDCNGRGEK